jgi:hypothetical protein
MVRIEHYTMGHVVDPDGNVSFKKFHEARNDVVRACKLHGPTGPMGYFPFDAGHDEDVLLAWGKTADPEPAYWIIDDQYNAERYQYIECTDPEYFTEEWIRDLMVALRTMPGWGVGINSIPGGYALVFADKIMVTGSCLENARDLSSFVACAHDALRKKDKYVKPGPSGACKNYSLEIDRLICKVEYSDEDVGDELRINRNDVELVWRNPFTGVGMLTLKNGLMIELPDKTAFTKINEWFGTKA